MYMWYNVLPILITTYTGCTNSECLGTLMFSNYRKFLFFVEQFLIEDEIFLILTEIRAKYFFSDSIHSIQGTLATTITEVGGAWVTYYLDTFLILCLLYIGTLFTWITQFSNTGSEFSKLLVAVVGHGQVHKHQKNKRWVYQIAEATLGGGEHYWGPL